MFVIYNIIISSVFQPYCNSNISYSSYEVSTFLYIFIYVYTHICLNYSDLTVTPLECCLGIYVSAKVSGEMIPWAEPGRIRKWVGDIPSGKHTKNYGKSPFIPWITMENHHLSHG